MHTKSLKKTQGKHKILLWDFIEREYCARTVEQIVTGAFCFYEKHLVSELKV